MAASARKNQSRPRIRKAKGRGGKPSQAAQADRHLCYEKAVQDPDGDAADMARFFRRFRKREALTLREDFCGTATLSTAWVKAKTGRKAVGIDLDQATMDWGRKRHLQPAGPDVERRVTLHNADVLDGVGSRADIVCALNFSYSCFKDRKTLVEYFRAARKKCTRDGVLVLDCFGGWESLREEENSREVDAGFVYRWEQGRFNAITHEILCYIHFDFPDGSSIERAFTYDWRLWSVPELKDALLEAGFSAVHPLWEKTDAKGEGTGRFYEPSFVENQESWWTYVVAER